MKFKILIYIHENYEILWKHWEALHGKDEKTKSKGSTKKVDNLPETFFGKIDVDLSTLPCLKKSSKEKITANFDSDVLDVVRRLAKKHHISYTTLINDVLRKVFVEDKKAS